MGNLQYDLCQKLDNGGCNFLHKVCSRMSHIFFNPQKWHTTQTLLASSPELIFVAHVVLGESTDCVSPGQTHYHSYSKHYCISWTIKFYRTINQQIQAANTSYNHFANRMHLSHILFQSMFSARFLLTTRLMHQINARIVRNVIFIILTIWQYLYFCRCITQPLT